MNPPPKRPTFLHRFPRLISILGPAALGLVCVWLAAEYFEVYGWTLFAGLPLVVSFASSLSFRLLVKEGWFETYYVSVQALLVLGVLTLLVALDGFLCLLMALPLALVCGLFGSALGYSLGKRLTSHKTATRIQAALFLVFPFLLSHEGAQNAEPRLHEVTTEVRVNGPIEQVWNQVIAFDEITALPTGLFRWGIAYPIRAKIEGTGVGAVRHCVFSTGPFVEPITVWDPPRRLEFDVISNPPPMKELSPWGDLEAPHLHDTFVSERGGFFLREENGQTVLRGTTWYRQSITPDAYWHRITDALIHQIHRRVLEHIKERVEKG